ncbi:MAG: LamG-like jellyroll fold domain-containing protein, partial [Patescibacteria group bacterium]
MSLTSHRIIQYIAILLILLTAGGAYWYWSVRGATKFGTDRASEKVLGSLVGYWPFDGGDISFSDLIMYDRSGQGNNGTLNNFDPPEPSASGLVGHWPMDTADISGTTVSDRSGSGNNGTGAFLAASGSQAFAYTGASQTLTVPAGITSVTIKSWGAGAGGSASSTGGAGGYSTGTLAVTPGETLNVYVGGAGLYNGTAGYNGGGDTQNTGGSGGGASDVRQGGTALSNRVIIAGAGGGGGYYDGSGTGKGGAGGGTNGVDGVYGYSGCTDSYGRAGTQTAGGAKATYCGGSYGSTAGSLGSGGAGTAYSDGGGGGGYYGGSGGEPYAGGGGGSGYVGGVTSSTNTAGSGVTPPNTSDSDYASGVGVGGAAGGNGGNGRVVFSWTTTSSNPVTGRLGQALSFDGVDDYVDLGTSVGNFNNTDSFSVSAWVYIDTLNGASRGIVSRITASQANGWQLRLTTDNKLRFLLASTDAVYNGEDSGSLSTGVWYHVVGTWNGSDAKMYVNAVESISPVTSGTVGTLTGTRTLAIGADTYNSTYFDGKIDDPRIYNRALSATEVKLLYNYTGARAALAAPGKVKQAIYFDGTNDSVSVTDTAALELGSSDFTIDFFAKFNDLTSTRGLVSKWGASGGSTLSYALDWVTGTNQ